MNEKNTTEPSFAFSHTLVAGSVKGTMKELEAKSRDLWQVPVANIRVIEGFNVRIRDQEYLDHLRNIATSIKTEGFWQHRPLAGYVSNEGGANIIYVTEGHTRLEAANIAINEGAEIQFLPIVVSPPGTSMEDLTIALVKSNEGKPLTPYETAIVCKRLIGYGWEPEQIADRLNYSKIYVEGLLALIGAPKEIRDMVQAGHTSATTAIQTLRKYGAKAVDHLADGLKRAQDAGGTKVTTKHLPVHVFKKQVKKAAPLMYDALAAIKTDPGYASLSEELRTRLDELLSPLSKAKDQADLFNDAK